MAQRPVFIANNKKPYCRMFIADFEWNGGFAKTQAQKNIAAMHKAYMKTYPNGKTLEISSKSENELGVQLSAFNLMKKIPSADKTVPLECVFQAGKVFSGGGPYTDLLEVSPKDAKRDDRLRSSGRIIGFRFDGIDYPSEPKMAFYDWMYYLALKENMQLFTEILSFDAFTDIAFNPAKSLNCQAQSAARIVGIIRTGNIDLLKNFDSFLTTY